VTSIAANTANDVGGEVLPLGTVVLAVADLAAVLASLVFIVTQSTVQSRQFAELVPLQLILALRNGCSLSRTCQYFVKNSKRSKTYRLYDVVNQRLGFVHLLLRVGHNQAVKIFFLVARVGSIRAAFALLDGALAANGNLGARLCLHLLEGIATRSDK
jgi:hypothetical protein